MTNNQAPITKQSPITTFQSPTVWSLVIGYWNLFGDWELVIGDFPSGLP
jgi:hypothetical protein